MSYKLFAIRNTQYTIRFLLFALVLTFSTLSLFSQRKGNFININISGQVITDSSKPVPNHMVNISCDSLNKLHLTYHKIVKTDKQGFYVDTIRIPSKADTLRFYVALLDCNYKKVTDTVTYILNINLVANFTICLNSPQLTCKANFEAVIDSSKQTAIQFIDKSLGFKIIKWKWNFGDGLTSGVQNPIHDYKNYGTYYVCLSILSKDSLSPDTCKAQFCELINVKFHDTIVQCKAGFIYNIVLSDTTQMTYKFKDTSLIKPLRINEKVKYLWVFGDGQYSTAQNPVHRYKEPGYYDICLTIRVVQTTDTLRTDCDSKTCIRIFIVKPPCKANFEAIMDSSSQTTVQFINKSLGFNIVKWKWNFGDGTEAVYNVSTNPIHDYKNYGPYYICLSILSKDSLSPDTNTCKDTFCKNINVQFHDTAVKCKAGFIFNISLSDTTNMTYEFKDTSLIKTLQNNEKVKYLWVFGDGQISTAQNPVHRYKEPGNYDICLIIRVVQTKDTLIINCDSKTCINILIGKPPCKANFEAILDSTTQTTFQFIDKSQGFKIVKWRWNFGDGLTSVIQNPIHDYKKFGPYQVCLSILSKDSLSPDTNTCRAQFCENINVQPHDTTVQCKAGFVFNISLSDTTNMTYEFKDTSLIKPQHNYEKVQYLWQFGDGQTSTVQNPVHRYKEPDNYNICLIISVVLKTDTTIIDCNGKTCINILIGKPPCKANFLAIMDSLTQTTFQFIDKSQGFKIVKWEWNFGDGLTSVIQNPIHDYKRLGNYHVCLSILSKDSLSPDTNTCRDTFCKNINIQNHDTTVQCNAGFVFNIDLSDTTHMRYKFKDTSLIKRLHNNEEVKYLWEFGDGQTSTAQNPIHIYTEPDYYNICLIIRVVLKTDTLKTDCDSRTCIKNILIGKPKFYNLGGQVFEGSFPIQSGTAKIYRYKENQTIRLIDTMYFDTLGYYYFFQIMEGNYIVKILPDLDGNSYFPTYYGNKLLWKNSQIVYLNKNLFNEDIQMIPKTPNSGKGHINGSVTLDDTLNNDDIEVILYDNNLNPLNYKWTDINRNFHFDNIAFGTYELCTEITGWLGTCTEVTIDENNSTVNVNLSANSNTGINEYAIPDTKYALLISNIYPNPVEDVFYINIILNSQFSPDYIGTQFSIFNILGSKIDSKNVNLQKGNNTLSFETTNLPKGIYFLKISSVNTGVNVVKKFIKW